MSNHVLLIDDDPRLVAALQIRLEALGYQVYTASCGEDGIVAARRHPPDVIILDISMPGMDGYEVCRRVRVDARLCATPIVVISAIAHEAARRAALEAGANQFLAKPYEASQVMKAIRTAIDDRVVPRTGPASSTPSQSTSSAVTT